VGYWRDDMRQNALDYALERYMEGSIEDGEGFDEEVGFIFCLDLEQEALDRLREENRRISA
jgi:hypothetical protein